MNKGELYSLPSRIKDRIFVRIPYDMFREYEELLDSYKFNLEIYVHSGNLDTVPLKEFDKIGRNAEKNNVKLKVHGPFLDLLPGSSDSRVRKLSIDRYRQTLEICSALRATSVVMHSGFDPLNYGERETEWMDLSVSTFIELMTSPPLENISIHVENHYEPDSKLLLKFFDKCSHPLLGHCFDIGHFNVYGKSTLSDYMKDLAPYIKEIHVHDNDGSGDQHANAGDGSIDFDDFFDNLSRFRIEPVFTLENLSLEETLSTYKFIVRKLTI